MLYLAALCLSLSGCYDEERKSRQTPSELAYEYGYACPAENGISYCIMQCSPGLLLDPAASHNDSHTRKVVNACLSGLSKRIDEENQTTPHH